MTRPRWLALASILLFSLLAAGCADPIRTYEVPHVEQRMLGAIIPSRGATWFVKLMGPSNEVEPHGEAFNGFVKSLRFKDDDKEPIAWTTPDGWQHEAGKGLRHATFRLPKNLEVTLFRFSGEAGAVLANINRWRGQLNLDPIDGRELLENGKVEKLEGEREAFIVDMRSRRVAPVTEYKPRPESNAPFDYNLPAGWTEKADRGAMAVAAFTVEDGGMRAEITVTPLAGAAGGIASNINRWRKQVGLGPATEQQLMQDKKNIQIGNQPGILVELHGTDNRSILGAIGEDDMQLWFWKMTGDTELVRRQGEAFEQFLRSIRFRGGE